MIRNVWGLSNVAHNYFIEHVTGCKHIRTIIFQRFLTFIQSLLKSKKKCLVALANFVVQDQGSTTCQNLNVISKESGLEDILEMNPHSVVDKIVYSSIPEEDEWKINLLDELLQLKSRDLEFDGQDSLNLDEIQKLIKWIASV